MLELTTPEAVFVICAFLFQIILIIHFALRKWRFNLAMLYGPLVYALGIPAAVVSLILLLGGQPWSLWLGGFLYLAWGLYGYWIEYMKRVQWRNPPRWSFFGPYVTLYLATVMFYWWPLALISRSLWVVGAVLFVISTAFNDPRIKMWGHPRYSRKPAARPTSCGH
jgi:hypothetical protein